MTVDETAAPVLEVVSFVNYPGATAVLERDRDAVTFIRAIKARTGSRSVGHNGSTPVHDAKTQRALEWFGKLAALVLSTRGLRWPVVLVPVPSSDCYLGGPSAPSTLRLASAIADRMRACVVVDALRWKKRARPSHCMGIRNPSWLYNNLELTSPLPDGTLVVVDDVFTTGSHVVAAAARISTEVNQCRHAVCAGRTVWMHHGRVFAIFQDEVPRFSSLEVARAAQAALVVR